MNFNTKDLELLNAKGITTQNIETQIQNFKEGFPPLNISRAAVLGDGILCLGEELPRDYAAKWDSMIKSARLQVVKFVPASGAATRMFKDFYAFLQTGVSNPAVEKTLSNITRFAFYDKLVALGTDLNNPKAVISAIVAEGLNYGAKPKALIEFHHYPSGGRTACEEHLVEGAQYAASEGGVVNIHFTISAEHQEGFEKIINEQKESLEKRFGVKYAVNYSVQKASTDTIAVDQANQPMRTADGDLLFRPSGHGALIENLGDIDGDVIFIKTIDNLCCEQRRPDTILYKKALGALALELQSRIFSYLRDIELGEIDLAEAWDYAQRELGHKFPETQNPNIETLSEVLNRPLRVCGMVKNEGEPGGGPFWVLSKNGEQSLQIAESAQIAPEQKSLMASATHFNPVDIIVLPKDYKGKKFELNNYTDPQTGFISSKSFEGQSLKAMELPGLWNGAMAKWNTVFVEVPISTFSPVKVLEDLLREAHQ